MFLRTTSPTAFLSRSRCDWSRCADGAWSRNWWWAAPRKLVHLKWKSLGKLEPGGTREQETDRRRSEPIVEGRRPRPGQGTDRLRLLPRGRRRPDHLPSMAGAA